MDDQGETKDGGGLRKKPDPRGYADSPYRQGIRDAVDVLRALGHLRPHTHRLDDVVLGKLGLIAKRQVRKQKP